MRSYPSFSLRDIKAMTVRERTNWINRAIARNMNIERAVKRGSGR